MAELTSGILLKSTQVTLMAKHPNGTQQKQKKYLQKATVAFPDHPTTGTMGRQDPTEQIHGLHFRASSVLIFICILNH